ncbi:YhdP family protein [Aliiglaciecola litoralis]|uniref:YhdP family protein n=1 Tax=Aliiglaciecola litoralis TaxID=582857 RepID=A0ABN1LIT1_9ALTE
MKPVSFYAAYILKKLWTFAAILLVVVAVSISVLRFSLPYMENQKHRVETWLSNQYGVELRIGQLSADWNQNGPTLVLKNVHLKQDQKSPIGLQISETLIELNFWESIMARQVQSQRFELNGLALSVNLALIQTSENEFPIVEAMQRLFLEQLHRFSISNSIVDVITQYDQQLIQIQQLSWINKANRHQGVGQLRVVELANNSATFTLDLYGGKDDLNGTFYARGEELDLSPWLNQLVRTQNQLTQSRGNFTFWAGIKQGRVENAQIELQKSEFAWTTPDARVEAAIVGGRIRAVPDSLGWKFNIDDLTFESQQRQLVTSWVGHIGRDGSSRISNVNSLDMGFLLPLLPLAVDKQTIEFVERLSPKAHIDNFAVSFGSSFLASVDFSQVQWNQVDSLPGLANITGRYVMNDEHGRLTVQGIAGKIQTDNVMDDNLLYENLYMDAYFEWHDRGLRIDVPEFNIEGDQFSLNQQFSYDTQDNQLALFTELDSLPISSVKKLFPNRFLDPQTKNYLVDALQDGQLASAQVLWQGALSEFPFANNQGVFQAKVDLTDSTLKFAPSWPALTELDIKLLFENEALFMRADKGQLMDVSLSKLSAQIPRLASNAVLSIQAQAHANSKDAVALINNSDLAESLGQALTEGIRLDGTLTTQLDLTIPLGEGDVVAAGSVALSGNSLTVPSLGISFDDVKGQVSFNNDLVTADDIVASLFSQPVTVSFQGRDGPAEAYLADIGLSGDWQLTPLLKTYQPSMSKYVNGNASWQAQTKLTLGGESYAYSFELSSQLKGVGSELPAPFTKDTGLTMPLSIIVSGQNQASNINLKLADNITFEGVLPHDTMQFSRAHLAIGADEAVGMGLGFSISANLPFVDFDAWFEAISVLVNNLPSSEAPMLSEPQRVYVNADSMLIAGQNIQQLELVAKHSTEDWLLEFNADQIRAEVIFYDDWLNRGIDIKADFIELADWQGEKNEGFQQANLQNLPPVNFACKSCKLFGKDLGRVDFSLSRSPKGMQIDNLRFNNTNGILYATGEWQMSDAGSKTQLQGELSSPDFGALLKGFGLDSGIKDSKANFDFNVSWDDAPHKFSLASLNGAVDWRLTDGYLSDVSDQGARLFSILSLQSLIRKLSLDFRDVFAKGFFYDKMDGSFQIVNGRADTRDTVIDGSAGEMVISGYADLSSQEINYLIEFAPNVTSSLPLLVYWMVNPATAIAALAIDQVLTEAKVISNVRYSVTGSFDEPVFTELDRKSKEVALPARTLPPVQSEPDKVHRELPDERVNLQINKGGDPRG